MNNQYGKSSLSTNSACQERKQGDIPILIDECLKESAATETLLTTLRLGIQSVTRTYPYPLNEAEKQPQENGLMGPLTALQRRLSNINKTIAAMEANLML